MIFWKVILTKKQFPLGWEGGQLNCYGSCFEVKLVAPPPFLKGVSDFYVILQNIFHWKTFSPWKRGGQPNCYGSCFEVKLVAPFFQGGFGFLCYFAKYFSLKNVFPLEGRGATKLLWKLLWSKVSCPHFFKRVSDFCKIFFIGKRFPLEGRGTTKFLLK